MKGDTYCSESLSLRGNMGSGVVLVQNVVGDTAEQVASHSARQEAAELAALVLQQRWQAEAPMDQDAEAPTDQDDAPDVRRS